MSTTVLNAAEADVELEAAFRPRLRVPDAVQQVGHEQAAEEHDLGDEEDPHAQRGRFLLLLQRLEVVLQRRMMACRAEAVAEAGACGSACAASAVRQL